MNTAPSRRAFALFLLAGLLFLAQLIWWVTFQIQQSRDLALLRNEVLQARLELASRRLGEHEALEPGAAPGFDEMELLVPGARKDALPVSGHPLEIAIRPAVFDEIEDWRRRKVFMFLSEGGFFMGLLLVGLVLIYLTLRREVALERLQSNFVAAVTHELKSPLASIRLYLDTILLGRAREPEKLRRFSETMLQDVERLEQLIQNLLDVGRIESRSVKLHLEVTCLSAHLEDCLDQMTAFLERKDARLETAIEPDLFARIDPECLRVVVRNLVDNAVKYGGPKPRVTVTLDRAGPRRLELAVRDEGQGVPEDELEKIFERFYRVGDEMVRSGKGTGLGLFLVRELIRAQRGDVRAENDPAGTGFLIRIGLPEQTGSSGA